jgi:hypothetical protein
MTGASVRSASKVALAAAEARCKLGQAKSWLAEEAHCTAIS